MTKRRTLLALGMLAIFFLALPVYAGDWKKIDMSWQYDAIFDSAAAPHGVVVDKYNRIWVGNYGTKFLVIKNPDGTEAPFSPIDSLTVPHPAGGDTTIPARYCRGLAVAPDGNIIFSKYGAIVKINVDTGEPMAWTPFPSLDSPSSPLKPAIDSEGYMYVGKVVGVSPVYVIDPNSWEVVQEITLEPAPSYARGMEVTADGTTLFPGDLTPAPHAVYIYKTEDFVNYPVVDSIWTDANGDTIFTTQTVTVDWGPDSTLWYSQDNSYGQGGPDQQDNALVVFNFKTKEYGYVWMPDPDDSLYTGPRGVAFSVTGDTAYVACWNGGVIWRYIKGQGVAAGPWQKVENDWRYDAIFDSAAAPHGVVVDKYGRIWVGNYGTKFLVIKNPDGTEAPFSPIDSLTVPHPAGGDTTIPARYCRGLAVAPDGNIIFSKYGAIVKINVDTGEPMAWTPFPSLDSPSSPLKPAIDSEGYMYVGKVVGVSPVYVIDPNSWEVVQEITLEPAPSYARGMEVTADGTTLFPGDLTPAPHAVYIYKTEDFVNYPVVDSIWTDANGDTIFTTQTVTVDWGPDSTLWYSQDNSYGQGGPDQKDNALVVFDFKKMQYTYVWMPDPDDSLYTGPRGVAFSPSGDTAYVACWNGGVIWRYVRGTTGVEENIVDGQIPKDYELLQNYPNPFNPSTTITFALKKATKVELRVYDLMGREVATLVNQKLPAGKHSVTFDASNLPSGTYFYRLKVDGRVLSRKMMLVK